MNDDHDHTTDAYARTPARSSERNASASPTTDAMDREKSEWLNQIEHSLRSHDKASSGVLGAETVLTVFYDCTPGASLDDLKGLVSDWKLPDGRVMYMNMISHIRSAAVPEGVEDAKRSPDEPTAHHARQEEYARTNDAHHARSPAASSRHDTARTETPETAHRQKARTDTSTPPQPRANNAPEVRGVACLVGLPQGCAPHMASCVCACVLADDDAWWCAAVSRSHGAPHRHRAPATHGVHTRPRAMHARPRVCECPW